MHYEVKGMRARHRKGERRREEQSQHFKFREQPCHRHSFTRFRTFVPEWCAFIDAKSIALLRVCVAHVYCSAFTPAVAITFAHLAISSSRNLPASSGVLPTGSMPMVSKRPLISAEVTALAVSAAIRLTMSFGVPAGARNKTQVEPSIGGPPASAMVGTSAAPATRLAENIASALILPPRTCGISVLGTSTRIWMLPPIRSCSAGAVPLYGTCTISTPAVCLNSSVVRFAAAPTPEEPKEILPGLAFAYAINCLTSFGGRPL